MRPPLYDEVHQLSIDVVNASASEDRSLEWEAYNKLETLCVLNKNSEKDHPIQWEALADFTRNADQALLVYQKALQCSILLGLNEYSASINLSMAERYLESKNVELALELAHRASELAKTTNNLELRKKISDFLLLATNFTQ